MNLYSITLFDRSAPGYQVQVALWAIGKWAAYRRGRMCGQVIEVEQMQERTKTHTRVSGQPASKVTVPHQATR